MKAAELALEAMCDPMASIARAQTAVSSRSLDPEERDVFRWILQAWWDTEEDARKMLTYADKVIGLDGHGSPLHRRLVLLSALVARSALSLANTMERDISPLLRKIEAWAWGDEGIDVPAARTSLHDLRKDALDRNGQVAKAAWLVALVADSTPTYPYRAAGFVAHCAALVASGDAAPPLYSASFHKSLANLAAMIRSALPIVPLPGDMP